MGYRALKILVTPEAKVTSFGHRTFIFGANEVCIYSKIKLKKSKIV